MSPPQETTSTTASTSNGGGGDTTSSDDIYDRQIRLWGAAAQAKMSKAKVLYVHVTAATSEVMKNLVLAGIPAAIFDPRPYKSSSTSRTCSFFLAQTKQHNKDNDEQPPPPAAKKTKTTLAHAVQGAVQELNPLLGECSVLDHVSTVEELLAADDAPTATKTSLSSYTAVVASRLTPKQAQDMAQCVTQAGNKFFLVDTFGMDGAAIMDLGPNHTFRPEKGKELLDPTTLENTAMYLPLAEILATPLHMAVNRFHKVLPPTPWVHYRLLLQSYYGSTANAADGDGHPETDTTMFVTHALQWCRDTGVPDTLLQEQSCLQSTALEQLVKVASCEIAPVASVLGGLVGNEVIKAISGKGTPANNTLLLDGSSGKAWSFLVAPKKK